MACENRRHIVPTLSKGVWNGIRVQRITKFEVLRDKAKKRNLGSKLNYKWYIKSSLSQQFVYFLNQNYHFVINIAKRLPMY